MADEKRCHAEEIFSAALRGVAPDNAVKNACRVEGETLIIGGRGYRLDQYDDIYIVGGGKGGAPMARAIEELLAGRISAGLISVKYGYDDVLQKIEICSAGHPLPDDNGLLCSQRILQLAESATEKTLLICLISGGGSALLPYPAPGITLQDKQQTTSALLRCGATIHDINILRKHLSRIKGGCLAQAASPATVVSLLLSDVTGDDPGSIASGPCVGDASTFSDCLAIVEKYGLEGDLPVSVYRHLCAGAAGDIAETPGPDAPFFAKCHHVVVANNSLALDYAALKAAELGYEVIRCTVPVTGEARRVALSHVETALQKQSQRSAAAPPLCLLSGGETTVTVNGDGLGGRNQEYALAAAIGLDGSAGIGVLSAGTDGSDGPTDAAGAYVDGTTVARGRERGLVARRFLDNNDSYHFFEGIDGLYKTGPTKTNVMDVQIFLINEMSRKWRNT